VARGISGAGPVRYRPGLAGEEGRIVRSRHYGPDVLGPGRRPPRRQLPAVPAERGLVVEDAAAEFCGAVVLCEKDAVTLEDRRGRRRVFPLRPAPFFLEGQPVMLVRPRPAGTGQVTTGQPATGQVTTGQVTTGQVTSGHATTGQPTTAQERRAPGPGRTASGSVAPPPSRAKVARASRIYVEGRHDAELVEKIWGDDLRDVGVVVEYLGGIDDLPAIVADFSPGPGRRLGVLVDHLVEGSKESRIAAEVRSPHVLVVGHPFIDVWAAVKPSAAGIPGWPHVPPGLPWKEGVLAALGWPESTAAAWRRILRSVSSFTDLEPAFLGRVEELIDFVTAGASGD
jgi:hypothetical protein